MKKMNSTILFSRFGKPENFWKLFAKEEEEVQRDSRVVKDCKNVWKDVQDYWNANQSLAFIDSSCLVKRTIRKVITFRKTWKPFEKL